MVDAIVDEELDIIESEKSYCYKSEEEVEEVARHVVIQKYTHMKDTEAMDFIE